MTSENRSKISEIGSDGKTTTLKLEGRLGGPWVEELRRLAELGLRAHDELTLDLKDVSFSDQAGATLLSSLARRGVKFDGLSPFLAAQIKSSAESPIE